ncbi:hypothetical protein BCCH1_08380 [Burkholderia contaminans]|jgi:hypothetical protein|uniref:17 kDa surface antigen n=4 Tax=Burkholderia TaxID=32008 RepID=A0A286P6G1_9BURK|nr:hypothetical protein BCCH1_08380 [Burkholderia contaminans]GLZ68016.1 hypothetical protein Bcon01_10610 [Burkholderia contaminans]
MIGRDRSRKKPPPAETRAPARPPPDLTLHYGRLSGKVLDLRIDISKGGEGRQMLKKWAGMAVMVGAAAASLPAVAGDTNNALGGALGGVAGAAVGNAVGGGTGAVIGGAVGGGAGGAVTSNKRERTGAIVGGALGGGAGTAAGNAMGGTAGGLVGAAVGGGAGAALGGHVSRNNSRSDDHHRGNKHKKRYKHD